MPVSSMYPFLFLPLIQQVIELLVFRMGVTDTKFLSICHIIFDRTTGVICMADTKQFQYMAAAANDHKKN